MNTNIYIKTAEETQDIYVTGSLFTSVKHNYPESELYQTWPEFVAMLRKLHDRQLPSKTENNLFCPAWLAGRTRASQHVTYCGVLGFDYDEGPLTPRIFMDRLKGLAVAIHSSFSSNADQLKFRAYIPLERPITAEEYRLLSGWLLDTYFPDYKFDPCSTDAARVFYLPGKAQQNPAHAFFEAQAGYALSIVEALPRALERESRRNARLS
jgi:hypothetical protein